MVRNFFIRNSEMLLCVVLSFACVATSVLILDDRTRNIDYAVAQLRTEWEGEVNERRLGVENKFKLIHQGLRTIARLPAVRAIDRYGENLSGDARVSIQEIYNNLASNVEISEFYIIPVDFSPDSIDPHTGELEQPIAEFDDLIAGAHAGSPRPRRDKAAPLQASFSTVEEIEIHEYRVMRAQIDRLLREAPSEKFSRYDDWPAVMSGQVLTCDNRYYSPEAPDDRARMGLVYSAPFYRATGELGGIVSAVFLVSAVERMLSAGENALVNPNHNLSISSAPLDPALLERDLAFDIDARQDFLLARLIPVAINDLVGGWRMWFGLPAAKLAGNSNIENAQRGALLRLSLILIIWIAAIAIIHLLYSRHRAMAHRNLELEAHVAERTRALESAKAEAERANNAKTRFLASVSHEIRTPLSAIIGTTDLLASEPQIAGSRERLKTIRSAGQSLLALIDQILNVSAIEAGRVIDHRDDVLVEAMARDVLSLFAKSANDKGLTLDAQFQGATPECIRVDDVSLRQVLVNLVGNAVKFTETGSVHLRTIALGAAESGRLRLRFEVVDTGIGVSEQARAAIFEPFHQASEEISRRHGGVGLGLAISQQLVTQLGGRLELDSAEGVGSRFHFSIEVEPVSPTRAKPSSIDETRQRWLTGRSALSGMRLLVVEDNNQMRELTRNMLDRAGAQVSVAASGHEALALIEQNRFDAILMDCMMPGLDGAETTRRIRAQKLAVETPIIALTANAFDTNKQTCMAAGMTSFLSKPFTVQQLVDAIAVVAGDVEAGGTPGPRALSDLMETDRRPRVLF